MNGVSLTRLKRNWNLRNSHSFCANLFVRRDLDFKVPFICDSLDDRVLIDMAHFCLFVLHVSLRDKLSLHASKFKTRSVGYYASNTFSRIQCTGRFLPHDIPQWEIKSCLDRDTTKRSSFGGFTVAIIPINRTLFQSWLELRAQVPPADQFPWRGFWAILHSSKTLSASRTFPENIMAVSQIPISGLRSSPHQLWLVAPALSIKQVFLPVGRCSDEFGRFQTGLFIVDHYRQYYSRCFVFIEKKFSSHRGVNLQFIWRMEFFT